MKKFLPFLLAVIIFSSSCSKKDDNYSSPPLSDYYPLQVGKYITYDMDSTVFIQFGTLEATVKYQAKDSVAENIIDNLGRPGFRIIRFIRKNSSENWEPNNTFYAIPTERTIEYIENNLRFIKLSAPVREGFSWKGNTYLPSDTDPSYEFASAFMEDWNYTYQDVDMPLTAGNFNFDSTITVAEIDEVQGDPNITQYADKTYSIEKYAKGIGLVYRQFIHWEYQANNHAYKGYGIKLTITGHN